MRKIVITNTVALNTGDAAILRGIIKILQAAFGGVEIVVIDRSAKAASKYYPDLIFKQAFLSGSADAKRLLLASRHPALNFLLPGPARRNLSELKSAQLIVSTGGTYLVPHYDLTEKLVQLMLAASTGKPLVLYTQSLGPFRSPTLASAIRQVASSAALILLRDRQSLEHLIEADADVSKATVMADAAFALTDEGALAHAANRSLAPRLKVAISVREWKFPDATDPAEATANYFTAIRAAVHHLVRVKGASVTFLSTCQGIPEYWTDDSKTADAIVSDLPESVRRHVSVDGDYHSPEELIESLGGFDFVMATRMHVAILALCAGTPVLPIAYEFKTKALFEELGFADWVQDIATMSGDALCELIDRCLDELPVRRKALFEGILKQHRSAMGISYVLAALGARGPST